MFIKTLTIQGFKSYHDQTQIESFSPGHNVVVGRNGSGKSNFFAAIRFVLSDAYTTMSREERQSLLHEGVSIATTLSAFVEIIFDNSDSRFPTGKDEVILRRTIGLKKDEYSLDKKSVSKADVMNLLESAGFSRANPYYIVPQGRITALTNAKDHERLTLLKEVAGTKVYESRRTESLRIMEDTKSKRNKITELLEYIETRLAELEEEKEELREWTEKDRERRCLEYAMYHRELAEVGDALEGIEEDRQRELDNAKERHDVYGDREKKIQALESKISELKYDINNLKATRHTNQGELSDLVKSRTELQCVIADLQPAAERAGGSVIELRAELDSIEEQIIEKEDELRNTDSNWDGVRARASELKRSLDERRAQLNVLYSKQGRLERFRTKAERDTFLTSEIASIEKFHATQADALEAMQTDLERARASLHEIEEKRSAVRTSIEESRQTIIQFSQDITAEKDKKETMAETRKALWREDTKLDSLLARTTGELKTAEGALAGIMDKDTGVGLRAVDRIAERAGFDGVYGPLYRLFEVTREEYSLAVELTAGNSLFHVVVDSDQTAQRVLDIMLKEKSGRVTFMPLNRLKPKNPTLPNVNEAFPLIDKLTFDERYAKAFQQVFGKTCVCKDLAIGAAYVKSHGINTITLDGDKVDRKGALTGGYHDVRRSRLDTIKNVTNWRSRHDEESKKSREVKAEIQRIDQETTRSTGQIQVLMNRQNKEHSAREALLYEDKMLEAEIEKLRERIARLETAVEDGQTELAELLAKVQALKNEKRSPMARGLTDEEETLMATLSEEVDELQKDLIELGKERSEVAASRTLLEVELKENLRRRREDLQNRIDGFGPSRASDAGATEELETRNRELNVLNASIEDLKRRNTETESENDKRTAELQKLRDQLEQLQNHQSEDSRDISRQQKNTERYHAKRQMLSNRKDECNRNIRDLGVLPEEAFEKYINDKLERLVKKLHAVNESLKRFAHVNKKAFEQYSNFTKQRDQLLQRREDLDKSAQSIDELVMILDQRKDEAIERTFKQVARNFEEVFEQLVPAGRGRLIIQRRIDQNPEADEDENTQETAVESYTGIAIKVSFNSKVDEGLRIQQLSGGQKSLVALALVFSIQKCDPAPFYLFDEIDANLDAQYRTAVANMIHSLSSSAQFITTTFRPEMLAKADKFYGVLFSKDKISSIRSIKREEAMQFVEQEAQPQ